LMARLRVRVAPRSSSNRVVGWRADALEIRLSAPPVEGAANRACVEFIAELLGVKRNQVRLAAGAKSREKTLEIEALTEAEVRARIAASCRA